MDNVFIGMTIQEFSKVAKKKQVVLMNEQITVYKVNKGNWYDSDGSGRDYRYFYFKNNKLVKIDKGQRAVDYRVKIDKN